MNDKKEDNMNRRTFLKGSVGLAGLALTAPYVARAAAGPLTLRFAHFAQEDHPANIAAKQFASRVEARTGGAIKINIFPNNSLGGPPEQAQQIKLGVIDMGLPTQGQLQNYEKAFGAVMLPFVFDSPAHVFRVLDGPAMAWLAPLAEKQGFILLRNWEYGFRNLTNSVRPINTPDDVKGLKIRTPAELQIQASMEALGGVVQAIAFPELYLALSQKVVDGEENPIAVIFYNKYYEVQKHLAHHPSRLQQHDPHGQRRHVEEAEPRTADDLPRGERGRGRSHAQADRRSGNGPDQEAGRLRHGGDPPQSGPVPGQDGAGLQEDRGIRGRREREKVPGASGTGAQGITSVGCFRRPRPPRHDGSAA